LHPIKKFNFQSTHIEIDEGASRYLSFLRKLLAQASMEVEHDESWKHRIKEVDETPHDAEAMEMRGRKRVRRLMVK